MRKITMSGKRRKVFAFIAKWVFFLDIIYGFSLMMPTSILGLLTHGSLLGLVITMIINSYIIKPST